MMRVFAGFTEVTESLPYPVLTIGNFDGLHLGHQALVRKAIERAKKSGEAEKQGTAMVMTFRPHPQVALRPDTAPPLLCTYDEKLELLERAGVEVVIEQPFSREFSTLTPEQFFHEVLIKRLQVREVVVGYDFSFGKGRTGSLSLLEQVCRDSGILLHVVKPHLVGGTPVSSSRIRALLLQGEVEEAALLLGRPFSYRGLIQKGDGRGRKIGFPTANLMLEDRLPLPNGVYATRSRILLSRDRSDRKAGETLYPSVTNVGVRPTFQVSLPGAVVETYLIDQDLDLYGETLEVQFVKHLRPEQKFDGISALTQQISRDIETAKKLLGERPRRNP